MANSANSQTKFHVQTMQAEHHESPTLKSEHDEDGRVFGDDGSFIGWYQGGNFHAA